MISRKSQNRTCNPFLYLKIPQTRPTGLCYAGLTRCGEQIRNAFLIPCIVRTGLAGVICIPHSPAVFGSIYTRAPIRG
jgi:hypothetical protein